MNGRDGGSLPRRRTACNLSPALLYKLNTLSCLLALVSRMHNGAVGFPPLSVVECLQSHPAPTPNEAFLLAVQISQAGGKGVGGVGGGSSD